MYIFYISDEEMNSSIKELETMILDCAKLDREINIFVDIAKEVTSEVTIMMRIRFKNNNSFRSFTAALSVPIFACLCFD